MLGHGAGIGYTGPGPRMVPIDNFSLDLYNFREHARSFVLVLFMDGPFSAIDCQSGIPDGLDWSKGSIRLRV